MGYYPRDVDRVPETVAVGRWAARAVSGVGELRERAELYDLAAERMNDRLRGALIGMDVGDALGAAVEFKSAGTFAPVTDNRGKESSPPPCSINRWKTCNSISA